MGIIKIYNDKKWTLQFLDALYNSIDIRIERERKLGYDDMRSTDSLFYRLIFCL
jgi:hypothetical protein